MMMMTMAGDAGAAAAPCQQAARHLVTLIKDKWPAPDQTDPDPAGDMIALITRKPAPGVVVGTTRFKLAYSRQEFTTQAKRQKPPFAPSNELFNALDDLNDEMVVVALPGTNLSPPTASAGPRIATRRYFSRPPISAPAWWRVPKVGKTTPAAPAA